jgi:outer membrane receptor protein involved in Fe transport
MFTNSFFGMADWLITAPLTLSAGFRASHFALDLPFEGLFDPYGRGLDNYKQNFKAVTWSAAAHYRWKYETTFFLKSGSGFRAPNVSDLTELGPRRNREYVQPNADLKPERSLNMETGFRRENSTFRGGASVFLTRYGNGIRYTRTGRVVDFRGDIVPGQDDPIPGQFREILPENTGTMYIAGVELEYDARFFSRWQSGFRFTWMDGRVTDGDSLSTIAWLPPASGMAYVRYTVWKRLVLQPEVRFNGPRYTLSEEETADFRVNPTGTDGFIVSHFSVEWTTRHDFLLRLRVENLFNQVYRDHGSTLDGLQRNVTVTARYRF